MVNDSEPATCVDHLRRNEENRKQRYRENNLLAHESKLAAFHSVVEAFVVRGKSGEGVAMESLSVGFPLHFEHSAH